MKKFISFCLLCVILLVGCAKDTTQTFKASADGYGGEVFVSIIVDENGNLVDIIATGDNETDGIGTIALETIPKEILNNKTVQVDVIAGATITSNAVIKATSIALLNSSDAE